MKGKHRSKLNWSHKVFEDASRDDAKKDSSTCGRENLKSWFALTSLCNWKISIMDVKSAFLQRKLIERDIFIKPKKEAKANKWWKLKTTVYGLCDATRESYLSVKKELLATECVKSRYDDRIFYWHEQHTLQCILSAQVHYFC